MLDKPRILAFARFAKDNGADELVRCLIRNEAAGVVYHYEGQLVGDYDLCSNEDQLLVMIRSGKRP